MAHFAEIDADNIVVRVVVVPDSQEHRGHDFLADDLGQGGTWIQTSYNTREGVHQLGGTPLRLNYAGQGYNYDPDADLFYHAQPYPSWVLDENFDWQAPIPEPTGTDARRMYENFADGGVAVPVNIHFVWDEETTSWVEGWVTPI